MRCAVLPCWIQSTRLFFRHCADADDIVSAPSGSAQVMTSAFCSIVCKYAVTHHCLSVCVQMGLRDVPLLPVLSVGRTHFDKYCDLIDLSQSVVCLVPTRPSNRTWFIMRLLTHNAKANLITWFLRALETFYSVLGISHTLRPVGWDMNCWPPWYSSRKHFWPGK